MGVGGGGEGSEFDTVIPILISILLMNLLYIKRNEIFHDFTCTYLAYVFRNIFRFFLKIAVQYFYSQYVK